MTIHVRQLHPMFVGEVGGVDLAAPLPSEVVAELTEAINRDAQLRAAYDALAPSMHAKIDGLVAEHSIFHSRGQLGHTDYTEAERASLPPAPHRLVRVHPGSKRKTLYMGAHASHIVGWPMPE